MPISPMFIHFCRLLVGRMPCFGELSPAHKLPKSFLITPSFHSCSFNPHISCLFWWLHLYLVYLKTGCLKIRLIMFSPNGKFASFGYLQYPSIFRHTKIGFLIEYISHSVAVNHYVLLNIPIAPEAQPRHM